MASLIRETRDGRKSWRVQFYEGDVRRSLGLGSVSKRIAEGYKRHVEKLTRAKEAGHRADAESIRWADSLSSRMRERLVALNQQTQN